MKHTRRNWLMKIGLAFGATVFPKLNSSASNQNTLQKSHEGLISKQQSSNMELGAFSISLTVKDLKASKKFYENFGFSAFAGDMAKNYLIMKNGNALIGLFHGMFEKNILTFNPGWDENANKIESFVDVREIQRQLKSKGIKFESEADEKTSGPAGFIVLDPDGNPILVDQHV
jgi:catechol 2,3-dioxygenase-like lactoylglutathione lyase family enzyme